MADENKPGAGGTGESPSTTPEAGAAPSVTPDDQGKGPDPKPSETVDPAKAGEGDGKKSEPKADDPPPTRKSKIDFIIERKQARLEKEKQRKLDEVNEQLKNAGVQDEDDEQIDPDEEERISKIVEKRYGSAFEKINQDTQENEVAEFITKRPEFAPYKERIKQFASHPSRKDIPLLSIAYEIAGDDLIKIGAERERQAQQKAKESQLGGSDTIPRGDAPKSVLDMSKTEFEAHIAKIKQG